MSVTSVAGIMTNDCISYHHDVKECCLSHRDLDDADNMNHPIRLCKKTYA